MTQSRQGFTLIEVLLALMIVAIGMTALLKSTSLSIQYTHRIKERSIEHLVGLSAIARIQMHLVHHSFGQDITESTTIFGHQWYWRARFSPTPLQSMEAIHISISPHQTGPFKGDLIGYRYSP